MSVFSYICDAKIFSIFLFMKNLHFTLILTLIFLPLQLFAENAAVTKMLKERYKIATCYNFYYGQILKGEYYVVANNENGVWKYGICDDQGKELFGPKYDYAISRYDNWFLTEGNKVHIFSADRKLLKTITGYVRVESYDPVNELIVVSKEDKGSTTGVIDFNDNVVIPPIYSYVNNLTMKRGVYDDTAPVITLSKDGKAGIADLKGKILFEPVYDRYSIEKCGDNGKEFRLYKDGKVGCATMDGKIIIPADKYDKISCPLSGYRSVYIDGKGSYIDSSGKEIAPFVYSDIFLSDLIDPNRKYIMVKNGNKTGYVDRNFKEVIPTIYDDVICRQYGELPIVFVARDGKKAGAFKEDGTELAPMQFHVVETLIDNSVRTGVNYTVNMPKALITFWDVPGGTLWGLYDTNGKEVLKPEFAYVDICEGLILVNRGGETKKLKSSIKTSDVKGGLWGYYDMDGNEVIPVEFESLGKFSAGVANGVKDGVALAIPHPVKGTNLKIMNGGASEFNSPVDKDIPETNKKDNELFAFIFATEDYNNYSGADYALRDGETFKQYCEKTLGAPEKNVRFFSNATYGNIKSNLKKIAEIADVYDGDAKFIIYFSGLGTTDSSTGKSYLLGADAVPGAISQTAIDLEDLTAELEQIPSKWMMVVADAPFNGTDRQGKMLGEGRGVHIKAKQPEPKGPVFICTASSDTGNAGVDATTGHGLLTLALLENLRQNSAPMSVSERLADVVARVKKHSLQIGTDVQTPTVKAGNHPSVSTAKY